MIWLFVIILCYLIGSFPSGYLVGKSQGIDIRQHGSGNIGATNVVRVMGKKWGYLVFFCDALKGFISVKVGVWLAAGADLTLAGVLAGICCIIGHNYTVWLRFKGGKGIATSIGVLLAMVPIVIVLIVLVVWLVVFFVCKYVSLASICAALSLPVAVLTLFPLVAHGNYWVLLVFSVIVAALAVWRHRSNIDRLLHGKENRFGTKR
ncbi:MAG: glycerol-3-phosphate 1-O-acyltransferase PlsY [Verrucomicrobia bacterium]|nr:glycerol-3-phosphate 1-O-acyltransferase PlsY [Verrucomicrobiota bacterium]